LYPMDYSLCQGCSHPQNLRSSLDMMILLKETRGELEMSWCRGLQLYLTQSPPQALPRLLEARKGTILPSVEQDGAGFELSIVAASTVGTGPRHLRVELFDPFL
jgi:hypothetical protein